MADFDYKKLFFSKDVVDRANNICEIARECWDLQLSDSTGFSICERIPHESLDIILTDRSGTGFRRNNITPEDLILIDSNGNLLFESEESKNRRMAPVNVEVHMAGYRASKHLNGSIHWHDPFTNAFAVDAKTIVPMSLQSKTIGDVECVVVDDRKEKAEYAASGKTISVPTGFHSREDVYYVMTKVSKKAEEVIKKRENELEKHGILVTHFEHGMFAWGRTIDEAFENAYRSYRNCQTHIYNKILSL